MRSLRSCTLALSFALPCAALAQTAAPPVTPTLEPPPTLSETPLAPAYTIKAGTQLVIVDVSVKDKHGKNIQGLKASDFVLKESGKPQQIRNFDEHTAASAAAGPATLPTPPVLPPGEFTNLQVAPPSGALNIILIDQINTSLKDQAFMHDQLIAYLEHARPDARTAIFALNTRLVMLQGFTSDPAALLAAIQHKGKLKDSVLRDDTSGGPATSASSGDVGQILSSALGSYATSVSAFEAPVQQYQAQVRAIDTLDALNTLARFLVGLPDRKNLIWFAGDFPPNFFPSDTIFDGQFTGNQNFENEYRDTVNLLSRARVAVYPIDAQGLRSDQSNNATKSNAGFANGGRTLARNGNPEQVAHDADFANTAAEHMAMTQIAHDTGGEAFYNHNDLARGVNDVVNDGANYYTLSYTPDAPLNKDTTRTISVHVEAPGGPFELSYRRAYYTDKKQHISSGAAPDSNPSQRPASSLTQSLRAGSPPTPEILMRVRAYPVSTPDQPEVLEGNHPNPDKKLSHGPYRDYKVEGAASVLKFSFNHGADNIFHTAVDFVTYVYDAQGNLINGQSNTVNVAYPKAKLAELGRTGMHFAQTISVPAKGDYFLRIAIRDNTSGNVGALEIPVADIANLKPPAAASETPVSAEPTKPIQP